MSALLVDTSVLVASMMEGYPHFPSSSKLIQRIQGGQFRGFVSLHSLAEFYATLTPMPLEERVSPLQARTMIEEGILGLFETIPLSLQDYRAAIERVSEKGLKSGAIYDALIFQAALKKKIPTLVTWNARHFEGLSRGELRVVTPDTL